MTDKELHKLTRNELLEIMLEQQKEIERLQKELKDTKTLLESRKMIMRRAGSIAEASLKISEVFEAAQKAADRYVMSVKASYDRGVLQKEEKPVSEAAASETTVPKAELPEAEEPETEAFEQAASGAEAPASELPEGMSPPESDAGEASAQAEKMSAAIKAGMSRRIVFPIFSICVIRLSATGVAVV